MNSTFRKTLPGSGICFPVTRIDTLKFLTPKCKELEMRVAYVCLDPGVPVFGRKGCSVHCQEVLRVLRQRGFDIELFATRMGRDIPPDLQDIPRHELRRTFSQQARCREKQLVDLNPQIRQRLSDAAPFDLIYERYALWSFAAMEFAQTRSIPGVLEVNSPLINEQKAYRTLIDEPAARFHRDQCFRSASSIIAVSEQVAQQIRQNVLARGKTTTVPNGVDCRKFNSSSVDRSERNHGNTVIGFVGTLKPWHGVASLLRAFSMVRAENPEVVLKIVGDGPQRESLRDQSLAFSSDVQQAVDWLGAIPNSQIPAVLSTFDVAVAPYPDLQDFYFSPLKILEYMAAGLPVVASRLGQIATLIDHGISGMLVKPGCPVDLAESLSTLCDDPRLRSRLGGAARQDVEMNHTWQSVVDRILTTVALIPTTSHSEIR
jgi:glycosyltransferase involved in cell wall biosynthesis